MSFVDELEELKKLGQINSQILNAFSFSVPWMSLACSSFAFLLFAIHKHNHKNVLFFLFKWQYACCFVYSLNLILLDKHFTSTIFSYNPNRGVNDAICKTVNFASKLVYCIPSWMQVMITFDRFWSVFLVNKIKFKRTKLTLLILILSGFIFLFVINSIHLAYYALTKKTYLSVFNVSSNRSILMLANITNCVQRESKIVLAQDLTFVVCRVFLPLLVMIVSNFLLMKKLAISSKSVNQNGNSSQVKRRERSFTLTVVILNGSFLVFNLGIVAYYAVWHYISISKNNFFSNVQYGRFVVFESVASLVSYMYPLLQFWLDLGFNRLFRKEISEFFISIIGRHNQIFKSSQKSL